MEENSAAFNELMGEIDQLESDDAVQLMDEINTLEMDDAEQAQEGELDTSDGEGSVEPTQSLEPLLDDQGNNVLAIEAQVDEKDAKGFFGSLADMGLSALSGVGKAVQNTKDALEAPGEWLGRQLFGDKVADAVEESELRIPEHESQTVAGEVTGALSQSIAGFVGAAKLTGSVRAIQGLPTLAKGMTKGAIGDFFVFDEHEKRLSNIVHEMTKDDHSVLTAVSDFLAADENDSLIEGRTKNVLEGLLVGGAFEAMTLLKHVKRIPGLLKAGGEKAVADDFVNVAKEIEDLKLRSDGEVLDELLMPADTGAKKVANELEPPADAYDAYAQEIQAQFDKGVIDGRPPDKWINTFVLPEEGGAKEALEALYNKRVELMAKFKEQKPESWARLQVQAANNFKREVLDEATAQGVDTMQLTNDLLSQSESDLVQARFRLDAARDLESAMALRLADLARRIRNGVDVDANKELFKQYTDELRQLSPSVKSVKSEFARGLRSLARPQTGDNLLDTIRTFGPGAGAGEESVDDLVEAVAMADNPWAIRRIIKKGGDALVEYFYTNILSGPITHYVNIASTTMKSLEAPLVKMVGGLNPVSWSPEYAREGLDTLMSLRRHTMDSIKMVGKAAWQGESVLRPGLEKSMSNRKALSSELIRDQLIVKGIDPDTSPLAKALDFAGNVFTWPSRALLTEDETFLQLTYRTVADAKLRREGRKLGLTGDALQQHVEEGLAKKFDEFGAATDPEVFREAVENTFTTDLDNSTWIRKLGKWAVETNEKIPAARLVMPFPRVATNLTQEVVDHTFLTFMHRTNREAFARGGDDRARIVGKLSLGTTYATAAMMWKAEDFISGKGPSDFETRKSLEGIGWKPYSFLFRDEKTGKIKAVPFNRFQPFASILAASADLGDTWGHVSQFEYREAATRLAEGIGQAMEDVSFMKGLSDFFLMFDDSRGEPIDRAISFVENRANGFMPWSSLVNTWRSDQDPYMREAQGLVEKLMKRVPGWSEDLDPTVNIFGEHVASPAGVKPMELNPTLNALQAFLSPIGQDFEGVGDEATKEYVRLATKYNMRLAPPSDDLEGVDLLQFKYTGNDPALKGRTAAYFRRRAMGQIDIPEFYLDVDGKETKLSAKGFRQMMNSIFSSDAYRSATDDVIIPYRFGRNEYGGSKRDLIVGVKSAFEEAATGKLREIGDQFIGPDGKTLSESLVNNAKNKAFAKLNEQQKQEAGLSPEQAQILPVPTQGRREFMDLLPAQQ